MTKTEKATATAAGARDAKSSSLGRANLARVTFTGFLVIASALLGYATWHLAAQSEKRLAEREFKSNGESASNTAQVIVSQKIRNSKTISLIYSENYPRAEEWPFVAIPGFTALSNNVLGSNSRLSGVSSVLQLVFSPIVTPDKMEEFEEFAYNYYRDTYPGGTIMQTFNDGIYDFLVNNGTTQLRYLDANESMPFNSKYALFAPIFQQNTGDSSTLMLNLRFDPSRVDATDALVECYEEKKLNTSTECFAFVAEGFVEETRNEYTASIVDSISPSDNLTEVTGFIAYSILWNDVLLNLFKESVKGIDCVLGTDSLKVTYRIENGAPILLGVGDLHNSKYDKYEISSDPFSTSDTAPGSIHYTLNFYPTEEFFETYETRYPIWVTIGALAIIACTSAMFGLYDYTIRAAAMQNAALLEAKRRFVRFISHEVRTPLNSVIMGLKLLDVSVAEIMPNGEMDFEDLKSARVSDTQSRVSPTPRGSINSSTRSEDYSNIGPGKVGLDTSTVAEWLQLIHDINYNGQCAVDVLNDLLNYDKIEKGSLTLEKSVVSMWSLIERTTEEFTLQAKKAQVTITLDFCDLLPNCEGSKVCTPKLSRQAKGMADIVREEVKKLYVIGDVMRLAQVVRNLISNALKFTLENGNINVSAKWIAFQPPSSPQAGRSWKRSSRVHGHSNGPGLESEKDKSQKSQSIRGNMSTQDFSLVNKRNVRGSYKGILRLTVKDTGAGLSEEQLSELFGEGKQFNVNKLQSGQGSGLGLFITKGIVEQHGGKLTATSAGLGDGSAFTVELPLYFVSYLADDPEPTKDVEVGQAVSEDDYNVIKKLKILVVDDALSNRKILIRLLARWGHTCIEAANGQEAVEKYVKSEEQGDFIDVILMDSEMPVMSGPVAASKLRELGCILPIIGVSGNALPEDVKDFIQHGANEVLPKPVSMDDLIRAWRNNLHQFNEMRRQRELSKKSGVFSLKTRFSGKLGNGHESSKSRDSDKLSNFIMSTSRSNKMQRSPTSYSSYSKSGKNSDDRGVKARDSKVTLEPIRSESPQSSRQSKSSFLMKKCQVSPTQRMKKYAISVDSADHVEGDGQLDVELGKTKTDSSGYEMQSVINKPEDVEAGAIDANSFQIGMTDL